MSVVLDQSGAPARLISISRFLLDRGASLRVIGSMPLVVASWEDIVIEGDVDAGSHAAGIAGAGANPDECAANAAAAGEDNESGTGGGGGGALGGRGGHGGRGDIDHPPEPQGGAGGAPVSAPTIIRGGCPGANSGNNTNVSGSYVPGFAPGGAGGGAIQLTARVRVRIGGRVLAGGAGGAGAPVWTAAGGGGGGSGGITGIDSAQLELDGTLAANGGGGGEGMPFALPGLPGEDGRADAQRAAGGVSGTSCAGDDAVGSAGSIEDGADVTDADICGGGGGGGGAGFVLIRSAIYVPGGSAVLTPPPTMIPP